MSGTDGVKPTAVIVDDLAAEKIRPRTDKERRAYVYGYANALNDILDHGVQAASDTARTLAEAEGMLRDA